MDSFDTLNTVLRDLHVCEDALEEATSKLIKTIHSRVEYYVPLKSYHSDKWDVYSSYDKARSIDKVKILDPEEVKEEIDLRRTVINFIS